MVKLSNLLAGFIVISSSSLTFALNNNFSSTHDNNIRGQSGNNWSELNLNNFIVPYHHLNLYATPSLYNQAYDPSQADINININANDNVTTILTKIGAELDVRFKNFLNKYNLNFDLFSHVISNSAYLIPNNNYNILDRGLGSGSEKTSNLKTWNIARLFGLKLGQWASYNLVFQNELNNSSFNFSLNITNFALKVFQAPGSITFNKTSPPSINHLYTIWNNHANYFNGLVTIDFSKMLTMQVGHFKENIADFGTDAAAAFFLNPIHYHYWFSTYIDWKSYSKTWIVWQNNDYVIKLKNLNSTSKNDLMDGVTLPAAKFPIPYEGGGVYATWEWNLSETVLNNDVDSSSLSDFKAYFYSPPGNTISQQDNCFAFDSSDGTKIYIDNLAMTGSDYMPSYYRFDYRTAGWPATSSFNATVFQNTAYPSAGFNPANNIVKQITNLNLAYSDLLPADISKTQGYLFSILEENNPHVLQPYFQNLPTPKISYQFSLNSQSSVLVPGNNPATFKISYLCNAQWTASVNINIFRQATPKPKLFQILDQANIQDLKYQGPVQFDQMHGGEVDTSLPAVISGFKTSFGMNSSICKLDPNFVKDYGDNLSFQFSKKIYYGTDPGYIKYFNLIAHVGTQSKSYNNIEFYWSSLQG